MKIHKVDEERIYFIMDSGASGSIARADVRKLALVNTWMAKTKIDSRTGECLSIPAERLADDYIANELGL